MDLSPNDIRTYEFPSQMRGYDKDEVDNILEQAAQALDNVKQDNLKLAMEIDSLKSQITILREYEDTIKKAAIDARRNADTTVESAKNEASNILNKARDEAEKLIGSKEVQVKELKTQIDNLEETKKSFILEIRKLINSHHDMVDETAREDIKKNLSDSNTDGSIEVTESSDITRDTLETVADTPPAETTGQEEELPADEKSVFDEAVTEAIESQKQIDPELAAALERYQKPTTVSEGSEDAEHIDEQQEKAPQPGEFVETEKRAEDIPDGFIAGNESEGPENKNVDTDKVNLSSDHNEETPLPNIADELDNVAAKFEEEMDKAEKN